MALQAILGLSLLIFVHEFGHYISARAFGVRVEKFYIGFPPTLISKKIGGTQYGIGAIILGGFVKISGMIDESFDKSQMEKPIEPWEFRAKPAWQRLIIMAGGVIANIILGVCIYIILVWQLGEVDYKITEVNKHGIYSTRLGDSIGFQTGDKVLEVNNDPFTNFSTINDIDNILEDEISFKVLRGTERVILTPPSNLLRMMESEKEDPSFVQPLFPYKVDSVFEESGAYRAGIQPGDEIIEAAGRNVKYLQQLKDCLEEYAGQEIPLQVNRSNDTLSIIASVSDAGTLGFVPKILLEPEINHYGFFESIKLGANKAFSTVGLQVKAFRGMFKGKISARESLSGPIGIAKIFGNEWNWIRFFSICALLSILIGVFNLLPIPALDGGHIMFLLIEIVTRKTLSTKVMMRIQSIGMSVLLALMALIIINDIYKLLF